MDISRLLTTQNDLLITCDDEAVFAQLTDLALQTDSQIGLASSQYPLLSTLSMADNITLSAQYHRNAGPEQVLDILAPALSELQLSATIDELPVHLDKQTRSRGILLRTIAQGASILLMAYPAPQDVDDALRAAAALESKLRMWIICRESNAGDFSGFNLETMKLRR